jgi:probable phosphoglycerate mutase
MKAHSTRLLLIRHGEVEANRNFEYLGRRDDELNETGRSQAEALAEALAGFEIDQIVSSPLRRAAATAHAIAAPAGSKVEIDPRLIELDFGAWEGRSRGQVAATGDTERQAVERWEADPSIPPPGGESLLEVQRRVVDFADEIVRRRPNRTVVAVSHVGPIKALLCAALGVPMTSAGRFFLDPATISAVDWGPEPVVRLINGHAHLGFATPRWLRSP